MRTPRRVCGGAGPGGERRASAVGAGYLDGGWEFQCAAEEAGRGCVCVEEGASSGDGREVGRVGEVSRGIGGDFGNGGKTVKVRAREDGGTKAAATNGRIEW